MGNVKDVLPEQKGTMGPASPGCAGKRENWGGGDVYTTSQEGHCPKAGGEAAAPPGPKKL